MKADVITWAQLARLGGEGRTVLLDGGLVTLASLSGKVSSFSSPAGVTSHRISYRTPWGSLENTVVRGEYLVAVLQSGPDTKDQEGN